MKLKKLPLICAAAMTAAVFCVAPVMAQNYQGGTIDGGSFDFANELNGHSIVVTYLFNGDCAPCFAQMRYLEEAYRQYGGDVSVIGLSTCEMDSPELLQQRKSENGWSFPVGYLQDFGDLEVVTGKRLETVTVFDRNMQTLYNDKDEGFNNVEAFTSLFSGCGAVPGGSGQGGYGEYGEYHGQNAEARQITGGNCVVQGVQNDGNGGFLAVRTAASYDDSNIIGELHNGDTVTATDRTEGEYVWVKVPGTDLEGFVNGHYLA